MKTLINSSYKKYISNFNNLPYDILKKIISKSKINILKTNILKENLKEILENNKSHIAEIKTLEIIVNDYYSRYTPNGINSNTSNISENTFNVKTITLFNNNFQIKNNFIIYNGFYLIDNENSIDNIEYLTIHFDDIIYFEYDNFIKNKLLIFRKVNNFSMNIYNNSCIFLNNQFYILKLKYFNINKYILGRYVYCKNNFFIFVIYINNKIMEINFINKLSITNYIKIKYDKYDELFDVNDNLNIYDFTKFSNFDFFYNKFVHIELIDNSLIHCIIDSIYDEYILIYYFNEHYYFNNKKSKILKKNIIRIIVDSFENILLENISKVENRKILGDCIYIDYIYLIKKLERKFNKYKLSNKIINFEINSLFNKNLYHKKLNNKINQVLNYENFFINYLVFFPTGKLFINFNFESDIELNYDDSGTITF